MSRFVKIPCLCLLFCAFPALAGLAGAQTPELRAHRASVAPKIDGVLDDEAWLQAPMPLGTWVSYNPMRGEASTLKTDIWITYDDRAIYFAFHCYDPQPERIRTTISRRDQAFADDWVAVSLDSSRAGQQAYHMFVNPSGIQMDALNSGSNGENFSPDWVWQSAGTVTSDGYVVEIRLPLEDIRFRSGDHVEMGVMFFRRAARSGVSASWPAMPPGKWVFDTHVPLIFDDLHQRRLLEVTPSATLSTNQGREPEGPWIDAVTKGNLGASAKYGLTSTITVEGTVNPDFSQVESDAFQVEVNNRFPVFFSEKRPFFMEGLGLFNLAGTDDDANMRTAVHTRQIGDPSAGIKLTGTAGRQTFAFLSAADASPGGDHQRYFTIGRELLNFGKGQYIGALVTDTERLLDHNRVAGGDFVVVRGDHWRANGSFLYSDSATDSGSPSHGVAATGQYQFNSRHLFVIGQAEQYDRGFRMDTAFLNRVGITRGWQYQEYTFFPDPKRLGWIKRIAPFVWLTGAQDRVQGGSERFAISGVRMNFSRAASLRFDVGSGHEPFAGSRFQTGRLHAQGEIQMTRWLKISETSETGAAIFYDSSDPFQGDHLLNSVSIELQPSSRLNNNVSYDYVSFDRRSTGLNVYRIHIVNVRNTYQFTPRFFTRAILQYDSSLRRVLTDFLASYELAPGTVAHAGYGSLFDKQGTAGYEATTRALFFKVAYVAHF